ncbi:MAG TPA: hypothetical protein DCS93_14025 [Microscillaceae bacterium]|nr:hypothetical protein [Microscillaceae bacterium]
MNHLTQTLLFLLLVVQVSGWAQSQQIQLNQSHQAIDQQVWKPFVQAFNTYDAKLYNSVHSDDIFRVYPGNIREGKAYKQHNVARFAKAKKEGRKRVLEFKFIERKATKNRAYEVGFFKVKMMHQGKTSHYYGKFHVVIHKINGRWQIVQDWDNSELIGKRVGEEEYARIKTPIVK